MLIRRWFAKVVVSATKASRFAEVDENGIQELMVSSENEKTRKGILQKWVAAKEVEKGARRILPSCDKHVIA